MLSITKLNAKRNRKEAKRSAKRKHEFLVKVKEMKGKKQKAATARGLIQVLMNPDMRAKYNEYREKIRLARKERKEAKYGKSE